MAAIMAAVDRWVPITADYEIFIRADELTDSDYRVRIEVGHGDGHSLVVRCLSPLPRGFWLRPIQHGHRRLDPYDTQQFRLDEESA